MNGYRSSEGLCNPATDYDEHEYIDDSVVNPLTYGFVPNQQLHGDLMRQGVPDVGPDKSLAIAGMSGSLNGSANWGRPDLVDGYVPQQAVVSQYQDAGPASSCTFPSDQSQAPLLSPQGGFDPSQTVRSQLHGDGSLSYFDTSVAIAYNQPTAVVSQDWYQGEDAYDQSVVLGTWTADMQATPRIPSESHETFAPGHVQRAGSDMGGGPGSDLGCGPGSDVGGDPGSDAGGDPGSDVGGDPGSDAGSDPYAAARNVCKQFLKTLTLSCQVHSACTLLCDEWKTNGSHPTERDRVKYAKKVADRWSTIPLPRMNNESPTSELQRREETAQCLNVALLSENVEDCHTILKMRWPDFDWVGGRAQAVDTLSIHANHLFSDDESLARSKASIRSLVQNLLRRGTEVSPLGYNQLKVEMQTVRAALNQLGPGRGRPKKPTRSRSSSQILGVRKKRELTRPDKCPSKAGESVTGNEHESCQ